MPEISGMVLEGQDPETRIDQVIASASWILPADMSLVEQGKAEVLDRIAEESWVLPLVWRIGWVNIPAQEAQQSVETGITGGAGLV